MSGSAQQLRRHSALLGGRLNGHLVRGGLRSLDGEVEVRHRHNNLHDRNPERASPKSCGPVSAISGALQNSVRHFVTVESIDEVFLHSKRLDERFVRHGCCSPALGRAPAAVRQLSNYHKLSREFESNDFGSAPHFPGCDKSEQRNQFAWLTPQKHCFAANASRYEKPNTFTTVTTTNATKATAIRMSLSEAGGIDESYEPSAIVRDGASALCVSATNGAGADILLRITSPSRLPIMGAVTPASEYGA